MKTLRWLINIILVVIAVSSVIANNTGFVKSDIIKGIVLKVIFYTAILIAFNLICNSIKKRRIVKQETINTGETFVNAELENTETQIDSLTEADFNEAERIKAEFLKRNNIQKTEEQ